MESLRKKELLQKIEDETNMKPSETKMMNHYTQYLAKMVNSLTEKEVEEATNMAVKWNKQGVLPEKNEEGKLLVSSHDYNNEFCNEESFSKTCNWQVILPEWELQPTDWHAARKDKEPIKHKAKRYGKKNAPPKPKNVPEADKEVGTDEDSEGESHPVKNTQPCKQPAAAASEKPSASEPGVISLTQAAVNTAKETETAEEPFAS
ncbi:hypothetical protein DFH29DRAFT_995093 [Suillus ampliporus]|nr:hypothetical protein DFH29DRAFT_995093 [Suillus ampliporus]